MPADLVFRNGAVYTADAARRQVSAVAIDGGRIAAVGFDADVEPHIGAATNVVDLEGRSLLPGFQDGHVHPQSGGLARDRCGLYDANGREEYGRAIAAYAAHHPEREWVYGGGWSMDDFPAGGPTAAELDAVVPDRPVYLDNRDGHSAWVNSRALELAGIGAATAEPPGGRIERDAAGRATGALHEDAMALVERLLPPTTPAQMEAALLAAQEELHALGIRPGTTPRWRSRRWRPTGRWPGGRRSPCAAC